MCNCVCEYVTVGHVYVCLFVTVSTSVSGSGDRSVCVCGVCLFVRVCVSLYVCVCMRVCLRLGLVRVTDRFARRS